MAEVTATRNAYPRGHNQAVGYVPLRADVETELEVRAWHRGAYGSNFAAMPSSLVRVIAAVASRADTLLVSQRPAHKRHGALFEFPGGKCEPGESDADAARRELAEELGVEVISVGRELFAIADHGSEFLIVFVPVEIRGEPQCIEHSEHVWGTLHELAALPLAPGDRRFVEFLNGRLTNFSG